MRRPTGPEIAGAQNSLLKWYERNGRSFPWRKATASLYEQIIAEALLQRTPAERVAAFLPSFTDRYPTWEALADASQDELELLLRPLGLWKRRASSLLRLAKSITAGGGRFPQDSEGISALPGVGQYIANAISLFSSKQAAPLIDSNMARVLERCFGRRKLVDIRYDPLLQEIAKAIVNGEAPIKLNWAILDLAATTCTLHQPLCTKCPLRRQCSYAQLISPASRLRAGRPRNRTK
jgi:A/G-specific adenine glycosylase